MALTDRFSPFGFTLLGVLLLGLLFFAFLMTRRGDNPDTTPDDGAGQGPTGMTDGRAATGR